MNLNKIISKLKNSKNLIKEEAEILQDNLIKGNLKKEEILNIFKFLEKKGLTEKELTGFLTQTRKAMQKVDIPYPCLDTCGTGGDGLGTFNISTAVAIVSAALGIKTAKHGNKAASSQCGSADVLEELGVNIYLDSVKTKNMLDKTDFVFMFAPLFHPALINVKEARIEYAKPTYFNLLGPMLNPCQAKYQVIGVFDPEKIKLMGKTLIKTGSKKISFIIGHKGMDELSLSGENEVYEFSKKNNFKNYFIDPKKMGIQSLSLNKIKGGNKKENAKILSNIFENKSLKEQSNIVALNTALALKTFNDIPLQEGLKLAKKTIKNKKALKKLKQVVKISNNL